MTIKFKVKKTGNYFDKLVKGIKDLNGESVQIGHFGPEKHSDTDLTYAELMAIHHNPTANGLSWPPRPVLDILFAKNLNLDSPAIKKIIKKYNKMDPSDATNRMLLDELGEYFREEEKKIFGSSELAPNAPATIAQKGSNNPLIETGELREKTAYKTSKDNQVKEK